MKGCVSYTYVIIFLIFGYSYSADKPTGQPTGNEDDSDEVDNYNLIVKGIEKILEEDDDNQTVEPSGDTPCSEEVQSNTYHFYHPDYQQDYLQSYEQGAVGYNPGYYYPYQQFEEHQHYQQHEQYVYIPVQEHEVAYYNQGYQGAEYFQYHYGPDQPRYVYTYYPGLHQVGYGYSPGYSSYGQNYPQHTQESIQDKISSEPSKTKKLKHSYKHNRPTKSQATGEQPSQPSDQNPQPNEPLEPEHIPVEVGSDDEEPEEGAVGGAEGGEEDEEDERPSEPVKKCKEITFMKMSNEGKLVEMVVEKDYRIAWVDHNINRFRFFLNVEVILCDGETIFKHKPGKKYPSALTYNKNNNNFVLSLDGVFILVKYDKGIWSSYGRKVPGNVKLYAQNYENEYVEITDDDYYVDLTANCSIKFSFKNGVNCSKIMNGDELIWENTQKHKFPSTISVTKSTNYIIKFEKYIEVYGRRGGRVRLIYTRINKHKYKYPKSN
ncbi:hypothetical protein TpMuguga_02g00011 [Theileria parva strain Muguga]|uniref:Theileria-specific sub-telomeric protein, SVSP family n=1 Tax=Theileria parva TaxID=5875 RepID=Q4N6C6_THEPA|nr:uncharacterized protein TpMuguga_02g00011 [Theileria parva strain Muguga]EAN32297.1 hypothetical protein TpMuguga_02g00011 [Theileria parva strain Muguga]|eukprot:XP_764580.1 hypothetical protein [Theileria parva strain Muguga]